MRLLLPLLAGFLLLSPATLALTMRSAVSTTTVLEQPGDFAAATLHNVKLEAGRLSLSPGSKSGSVSGEVAGLSAFTELIPSWNANTPPGSSLTLEVKPAGGARFYSFGTWQSAAGRSSLNGQKDSAARMVTDTLKLSAPVTAFSYRLTLRGGASLSLLAFNTSDARNRLAGAGQPGDQKLWNKLLDVPQRSQMLYKDGGEGWCSPTSTSMILAYYGMTFTVPQTAAATFDSAYEGTGNWPFNTAYAASKGLRALVTRLPNLRDAERFVAAGIPLGVSLGWKKGELPGAAIASSDGHLMVLVGFDASGNPVLNDPASPTDAGVRRTYPRAAFEKLWLSHSGGLVYLISKPGQTVP